MSTTNSVTLTLGYEGTDFTRKYKVGGVSTAALDSVKSNILAYNAAVPEADKKVFISDDYDSSDSENVIGRLKGIVAAQIAVEETTEINLNE